MKFFGYLFVSIGIALWLVSLLLYLNARSFVAAAITARGTVIDYEVSDSMRVRFARTTRAYQPVVQFRTRDGRQVKFTSRMASSPPSYSRGEDVEVLYLQSEPQEAQIKDFQTLWGLPAITAGLGSVFFLVGGGFFLPVVWSRRERYLREHGTPVETEFRGVEKKNYTVNGKFPFRVVTQWQDPATVKIHLFKSRVLWFDPSDRIRDRRIRVFIQKNNPKNYLVDLSFLPEADG